MGLNMLFDNYDLLMDSPNSTVKMRKLILQLAVQGKLVDQDPNDEPASELLKCIKAEKKKLIAEGKIRKQKPLPPINKDEIPYELPDGWGWVRLANVGYWAVGSGFPKKEQGETGKPILFCKVSDMNLPGNEKWLRTTVNTIDGETAKRIRANVHPPDTVVFPKIGGAISTNKRRVLTMPTAIDNNCLGITPCGLCTADWIYLLLSSIDFTQYQSGTSVPALNQGTIGFIVTGLPALSEQKRIVAKVVQLMQLCDQLDACQKKASTKYESLNDAALEKLLSSKTIDEFAGHWQFLCDNFDLIYNDPAHANKLHQAILQLAVQGKLAPQDPNDEPASEFLKRIKAEKEKLIAEGKIKKQKPLPPIAEDEIPYELPQGWTWVRLGDICNQITDGTHHTPHYVNQGVPFLSVKDISKGKIDFSNTRFVTKEEHKKLIKRCKPEFENILFTKVGTTGIAKVVDVNVEFSIFVSVALLKFSKNKLYPYFLEYLLNSPLAKKQSAESTQGIGNKNLVIRDIARFLIPIPPLTEQKRIVSKVNQLMQLCDELETRLSQSKKDSEMLMRAVLHEAFS